ncbi:MAG: aspartate aminotransferase family protein [Bacteroidetes bacterium]|nr:aspartate aminotransferase family protein [Bacteroidota bacterium]
MTQREIFLKHIAQTSDAPLGFEISHAENCYLYDLSGKKHIDLIGGISVCNIGHGNKQVLEAIHKQSLLYLHVMVYGETIQTPQVQYAKALTQYLPPNLQSVYFTNSGSEATEGAMKLAKRVTGRSKIFAFNNSYHGSTQGALSIMGSEYWKQAYRPLLPEVYHFDYHENAILDAIDEQTACVIMEPVQAEAGVMVPDIKWMQAIRNKCYETGTLLIFDEIQTAFGRTGSLFRCQEIGIEPDILLLGKALGGGLPLGAFISSKEMMDTLMFDPVLGHITTFGGHPLSCAAGHAAFTFLLDENLFEHVHEKEKLFKKLLTHQAIQKVNSCGLLMAIHFDSYEMNKKVIDTCLQNGLFTDWFLFASNALRIAPPLIITHQEIELACQIILQSIDAVLQDAKNT